MNLRNLEGTHSSDKPRNQILETPESHEHKSRNQILAMPEGRDSSEKDEKLNQSDSTESKSEQSKRSSLEKLKGLKNCVTENLGKRKHAETGEKAKHPFVDKIKDAVEHAREKITDTAQHIREGFDKKKHNETDKPEPEPKKETTEDKKPEFDFSWGTSQRGETKTNEVPDKKKNNETGNSSDDSDSPHGHADREIGDDKPYNAQPETKNRDSGEQSNEQQREIDKKKAANLKDNEQILNLHNIDATNRNNEVAENEKKKNRQNQDWEIGD